MFQNLKWIRLIPDAAQKGGWKTGFHSFQATPMNDTRKVTSLHTYRGKWVKDHDTLAVAGITNDTAHPFNTVQALHAYVYPSLTDPTAQPGVTLLGHHVTAGGSNRYWDFTNAVTRDTHTGNAVPATFLNIAGRCFIADGAREGMILDDRTPAIHAQKNQKLGIGAPTQPPSGITFNAGGAAYVHYGSPYINHPNPANLLSTILGADQDLLVATIDPNWTAIYAGAVMAHGVPAANAVTSNVTPFTATGTISITTGTSLITLAGATWPANFKYAGLAINFNGYSYVISTHGSSAGLPGGTDYDLDGGSLALSNVQLVILGVYDGTTLSGVPYTITGCQVTITGAPTPPTSTLQTVNTGQLGYSQITNSNLVQVAILCKQANSLYRNLGNISLGPAGGSVVTTTTGAAMGINSPTVVDAAGGFLASQVGQQIIVDGGIAANGLLVSSITLFNSVNSVTLSSPNTSGGNITTKKAMWASSFQGVADAVMDNNVTVNLTSASNPWTPANVGDTIMIAGAAAGPVALLTTIVTYVNPGNVTVGVKNLSGAGISGKQAYWYNPLAGVTTGPTYAYAWYDPETGAVSNISPLFQLAAPTSIGLYASFANITPIIPIDRGSISYPDGADGTNLPTSDGIRFSHILFFRTLSTPGSSTLYPIGSLMPYVGKVHPGSGSTRGSWNPGPYSGWMGLPNNYSAGPPATGVAATNYWWDFSSDSDLILSGGFRAPQFTNSKPMALLRGGLQQAGFIAYQAYWDRRLWVVNTQEPDVIAFSCDDSQCPLGIPEESFPPTNRLRIPSVDGRILSLRVFAEMILATTERWGYTVVGNDESNYRLIRVSTKLAGVGVYQMDEFSSEIEGTPSIVYFFGKDGNFYEWIPGSSVTDISGPVTDILKPLAATLNIYNSVRVHCMSINGRRLVVVASPFLYSTAALGPLVFDIDNRTWTDNPTDDAVVFGPLATSLGTAMTTVYGLDPPVLELFSVIQWNVGGTGDITVRRWMEENPTHSTPNGVIETFPMNFDGKKTMKQLCMVNAHLSGGTATCKVSVNEASLSTAPTVTMTQYPDLLNSIYVSGAVPVDSSTAEDLVVLTAMFDPTASAAPLGYRFMLRITGTSTTAQEIYAVDIGYIDIEEPGEADA